MIGKQKGMQMKVHFYLDIMPDSPGIYIAQSI